MTSQIKRRLIKVTTDSLDNTFLFQRLSVAVQRFNAACLNYLRVRNF